MGLYRQCLFCEKPLKFEVSYGTRTARSSDHYGGEYEEGFYTGRITEPVICLDIKQGYDRELEQLVEEKIQKYARIEPRLFERADERYENEKKAYAQRLRDAGFSAEEVQLAAIVLADSQYEHYKPSTRDELREVYRLSVLFTTFEALKEQAKKPFGMDDLSPYGIKAHFECLEQKFRFDTAMYRSMAAENHCEIVIPVAKFVDVLKDVRVFKPLPKQLARFKKVLEDHVLTLELTKPR